MCLFAASAVTLIPLYSKIFPATKLRESCGPARSHVSSALTEESFSLSRVKLPHVKSTLQVPCSCTLSFFRCFLSLLSPEISHYSLPSLYHCNH